MKPYCYFIHVLQSPQALDDKTNFKQMKSGNTVCVQKSSSGSYTGNLFILFAIIIVDYLHIFALKINVFCNPIRFTCNGTKFYHKFLFKIKFHYKFLLRYRRLFVFKYLHSKFKT